MITSRRSQPWTTLLVTIKVSHSWCSWGCSRQKGTLNVLSLLSGRSRPTAAERTTPVLRQRRWLPLRQHIRNSTCRFRLQSAEWLGSTVSGRAYHYHRPTTTSIVRLRRRCMRGSKKNSHKSESGRSIIHRGWTRYLKQPASSSTWLWTYSLRVPPLAEDALVLLRAVTLRDCCFWSAAPPCNVFTYLHIFHSESSPMSSLWSTSDDAVELFHKTCVRWKTRKQHSFHTVMSSLECVAAPMTLQCCLAELSCQCRHLALASTSWRLLSDTRRRDRCVGDDPADVEPSLPPPTPLPPPAGRQAYTTRSVVTAQPGEVNAVPTVGGRATPGQSRDGGRTEWSMEGGSAVCRCM